MSPLQLDSYDIIICGGGTAGCVLAARLSEDPSVNVLLLEAGANANNDPRVTTPALFSSLMNDPERDWGYMSEPSPGMNGRRIAHPRGRCLGGSSAINLMAMVYPSKSGYDAWAEMGNKGWDWESMAPYFRKFQTHVVPSPIIQEALGIDYLEGESTGTSGPIKASFPAVLDPVQEAWINTWKKLQRTGNPMDGIGTGGFTIPASIDPATGRRSFAGLEYYEPAKMRPNLHVITGALVEKVEFDTADGVRASGVTFQTEGKRYTAKASQEVVLCAGAFGSPQILELSGVGDAMRCESLGIKSVVDNPNVGENLQDHLMCGRSYEVNDDVNTIDKLVRDQAALGAAMQQYQTSHSGPLASGGGHSFAYTPLVDFITPESKEDLNTLLDKHLPPSSSPKFKSEQVHYAFNRRIIESPDETSATLLSVSCQFHPYRTTSKDIFAFDTPGNYVSIIAQLSHPFSRGSVHISSSDPKVYPVIKSNYMDHPLDAEIIARHLLQVEKLSSTQPLASFLKSGGRRIPVDENIDTLQDAIEFAKRNSMSQYHPCGTCAMMPLELGGVVNERLVVHGTKNLRVVDASVFPIVPKGNIMTSVYAAAEKGADMLKEDLGMRMGGT